MPVWLIGLLPSIIQLISNLVTSLKGHDTSSMSAEELEVHKANIESLDAACEHLNKVKI